MRWAIRYHDDVQRQERDSFILLQHIYTVSDADPAEGISPSRAAHDLGWEPGMLSHLVAHLTQAGYLQDGSLLRISTVGVDYIERLAWRRRSVRLGSSDPTHAS